MSSPIGSQQTLDRAWRGYERAMEDIFRGAADEIRGELARRYGTTEDVPPTAREDILVYVGGVIDRLFVGADGRRAYADENGAEPLSPIAEALSRWTVEVQARQVLSHARYMRRKLQNDPEIIAWLERRQPTRLFELDIVPNPIFAVNPLAQYEAAHTWVDPNGYRLSDRIWRGDQRSRDKIDRIVSDFLQRPRSAVDIANEVEQFLLPSRAGVRTTKPYGTDVSFDAMRLGRTEISRAHVQANSLASQANPYVTGMDFALSPSHPRVDICDSYATIGMGGGRIREPYPKGSARLPVVDTHPMCLCHTRPFVSESPAAVTERLRAVYREQGAVEPPLTPLAARAMLIDMFGRRLFEAFVEGVG